MIVFELVYVILKFWVIMISYRMYKWDVGFIFVVIKKEFLRFIVRVLEIWDVYY